MTQEKATVLGDLAAKAALTTKRLNSIRGVKCNEVMGAMYAFPMVQLPNKAVAAAKVGCLIIDHGCLLHV